MNDLINWVSTIFGLQIWNYGTTAAPAYLTLGMLLAGILIFGFGIGVYKRLRGRG